MQTRRRSSQSVRTYNYALHGIRICVAVEGAIAAGRLFPSLHVLPRSAARTAGWRIAAGAGNTLPADDCAPAKPPAYLRVWPDVDMAWGETPEACWFRVRNATARLWPAQRRAKLILARGDYPTAEKLGRVLIMEIMRREGLFTFHAGAVETAGGVVLISGPSGSGKSTLATAWACLGNARFMAEDRCLLFARHGKLWAGGVSDEVALRPGTMQLLEQLGVRVPQPPAPLGGKYFCNPHDLFLSCCREPFPLRAIVFLAEGLPAARPVPVPPDEAFRRLQRGNFFNGPISTTQNLFGLIADLAACVPAFLVPARSDCRTTVAALDAMLALHPAMSVPPYSPVGRHSRRIPPLSRFNALRHLRRLLGADPAMSQAAAFDESQWAEIIRAADATGLLAALAAALQNNVSMAGCRNPIPNVLRVACRRAMTARARQLAVLAQVAPPLAAAGVRWVVVDGPNLAERFYVPPWSKDYPRIAIAVAAEHMASARQILADLSFAPVAPDGTHPDPRLFRESETWSEIVLLEPEAAPPAWRRHTTSMRIQDQAIPMLAPLDQLRWSCLSPWPPGAGLAARRNLDVVRIWQGLSAAERTRFLAAGHGRRGDLAREVLRGALRMFGQSGSQTCHCGAAPA